MNWKDIKQMILDKRTDPMADEWAPLDWFITGVIVAMIGRFTMALLPFAFGIILCCGSFLKLERRKKESKTKHTIYIMSGLTLLLIIILNFF